MGSFIKKYTGKNYKGLPEKVHLKEFDTIIAAFGRPAFVKMDVEGFEAD